MALYQAPGFSVCEELIKICGIESAIDVMTASEDEEIVELLTKSTDALQQGWRHLVDWASLQQKKQEARVYQEALTGTGPTAPLKRAQTPVVGVVASSGGAAMSRPKCASFRH